MSEVMAGIGACRAVAVLRSDRTNRLVPAAQALVESGITVVEFALTTPNALSTLELFRSHAPAGSWIGAGTVLTAANARDAIAAGAQYLVTPAVAPEVVEAAYAHGVPVIVGAFTPTEVLAAHRIGAASVKVFPASLGGPGYVRLLRDPFPAIPLIPTGGIAVTDVGEYLRAGAVAVGLGNDLLAGALQGGDLDRLRSRARELVDHIASAGDA